MCKLCPRGTFRRAAVLQFLCTEPDNRLHLEDRVGPVGTYDGNHMQLLSGLSPKGLQGIHCTAISLHPNHTSHPNYTLHPNHAPLTPESHADHTPITPLTPITHVAQQAMLIKPGCFAAISGGKTDGISKHCLAAYCV